MHGNSALSRVSLQIGTGRKHQLRSQLAHLGHPVLRDGLQLVQTLLSRVSSGSVVRMMFLCACGAPVPMAVSFVSSWRKFV